MLWNKRSRIDREYVGGGNAGDPCESPGFRGQTWTQFFGSGAAIYDEGKDQLLGSYLTEEHAPRVTAEAVTRPKYSIRRSLRAERKSDLVTVHTSSHRHPLGGR